MSAEILRINDPEALPRSSVVILEGEVLVYPTDTLYGLGADALDESAVGKVFEIKGRPPNLPLPVAVSSIEEAEEIAVVTPLSRRLAQRFLPGPLTLVLKARSTLPEIVTGGGGTVAVRIPQSPFVLDLVERVGPITATSANLHGAPSPSTVEEARSSLGDSPSLYIDGGKLPGIPSTIVDAQGDHPKLLRKGALPFESLGGI